MRKEQSETIGLLEMKPDYNKSDYNIIQNTIY